MKTVVICGSKRFAPEIKKFALRLKKLGVVVYEPYFDFERAEWGKISNNFKKFAALGLTHDHFYKIQMADIVFVLNKDGYAGTSTTLEIGYAVALGKPIYALSGDNEEIARHVLFREIISSPTELVKKLK